MKKYSKIICIPKRKACIVGLIISLIYAIITSFSIAYAFLKLKLEINDISISLLGIWLVPIFFILFGTCIGAFVVMFINQDNKN